MGKKNRKRAEDAKFTDRGVQKLCRKCENPCKVFGAPNSEFTCYDFVEIFMEKQEEDHEKENQGG